MLGLKNGFFALSPEDKLVALFLFQHSENGVINTIYGEMERETGISIRHLRYILDRFLEKGWINRLNGHNLSLELSAEWTQSVCNLSVSTKERKTLQERRLDFGRSLTQYLEVYDKRMIREFFDYWTEAGENERMMRFEKQNSFDIKLRLIRWHNNNKR